MTDSAAVYSQTRTATGTLVFVSGQLPVDTDGTVPSGITAQTRLVLDNIETRLAEHGLDLASVVKVTYFLCDLDDLEAVREVLRERLPVPRPAASLVRIGGLVHPHAAIEIEAIAQAEAG